MRNKLIILVTVLLSVAILFMIVKYAVNRDKSLASPGIIKKVVDKVNQNSEPSSSFLPTQPQINAPRTFKFNESTDLKKELESVNPQIFDNDFE